MTKKFLALAFVFLLAVPGLLYAQTATTSLRGTVKDSTGALVPGAKVTILSARTGLTKSTISDGEGGYQFLQLDPARFTITVSSSGFADQSKIAELLVNQPATVNFTLSVNASSETVNVSAETETLNTTDATLGNAFNNVTIQALPSEGRNVPELLALQPGVVYLGHDNNQAVDSRSGSVNGGRSDQGDVTMDGLDDNDQTQGYAFTGVLRETLDSVEEFRVTTSNSNATEGRSSGAQVTLVTKSGTNNYHGTLYEYHRPTFTVANDWFNKQAQFVSGQPNIPGKLIRNTFGADVGGYIIKDKLFFFGNYEGQRTAENVQQTQTVPTASFKAGELIYQSSPDGVNAGPNVTLTPSQIATMDPNCAGNGTCPWGGGDNPNILSEFANYPTANGTALGDGLNFGSYSFSSPSPASLNTSIVRLDYRPTQAHLLFVRGNLQKDTTDGPLQFPGQPPSYFLVDNTKGIAAGDTWTITPTMVNDVRYGYIRQGYSNLGTLNSDVVYFRFISQPVAQNRGLIVHVPVHNFVDNLSWNKNKHTFGFGANWRIIHNSRNTNQNSFSGATTNEYWIQGGGAIANTGGSLDPSAFGYPAVCCGPYSGFSNSYNIAAAMMVGLVPQTNGQYNYNVSGSGQNGTLYPDGAFIKHDYKANEMEYYLQDSWRVSPKLTLTYGIRHSFLQTPYEVNGQQVAPTIDVHNWFKQRAENAVAGVPYEPNLVFAPGGQSRGGKPYWPMQWGNVAPRVAFAYAANATTSIRGGFGIYYDHFGQGIVDSFDQYGSFGLTTSVSTPASYYSIDNSPRYSGYSNIPALPPGLAQPSSIAYPYMPPTSAFAITWGIDDHIKTPYSEAIDFSIQKEVGGGFTFETAYVGRFGKHLLQQLDLAEPVDLTDGSGVDYFRAATQLSKDVDQGLTNVPTIPYFEHLFPYLAGGGQSATQNIYSNIWQYYRGNETTALQLLDVYPNCLPANGGIGCGPQSFRYYQQQFSSLYAWSSIGTSSYNAVQFILNHPSTHGLELNLSYTFSKSLDLGSDAERMSEIAGNGMGGFSEIINSFQPKLNKGVSDFDTANNVTANWVYLLPVGKGMRYGGGLDRLENGILGNWQWSGLYRWTSGLPFSVFAPGWATNYQQESAMVETGPVLTHRHRDANGNPQVFQQDPSVSQLNLRLPYPGEAGQRNPFRGDGYFSIDSGLAKTWPIKESQSIRFDWEVFNVTNSVRFDTNPSYLNTQYGSGTLGVYSATLSQPRKMQFSLRYSF
ncbi:TonB-dependent receptor [Acidipila rosea]|uniref:TonB-dependent receptor n=1 Tax=Acidipila rosea TaxID=768535 RepID=UPI00104A8E12|nr:TonB-dependent receptor [Acidipila rosea]MBW4027728.1 TonB-dependent receptor [Acidobacteriota bacterium]MBW4045542.1 TonB-dependent receptor [Acidobacteriota bacterium]